MGKKIPNFGLVLIDGDLLHYKCSAVGEKVRYNLVSKDGEVIDTFDNARQCADTLDILFADIPDEDKPERIKDIDDRGLDYCKKAFKSQIKSILKATGAKGFKLYLGHKDSKANFRHTDIATIKKYKSGRAAEKPKYFEDMRKWILQEYNPVISKRIESDDRLCIDSRKDFNNSAKTKNKMLCKVVVATIDKDHLTVPGWLYNWDTMNEPTFVTVKAARKWFYQMCLIGDTVDSIQGCPLIGHKKAESIFDGCKTDEDYWKVVCEQYIQADRKKVDEDGYFNYKHAYTGEPMKKTPVEIAVEMATLLHMLRSKSDKWKPPFDYEKDIENVKTV